MPTNPPIVDGEIPSAAKWNTLVGAYERSTAAVDVVSTAVFTALYTKSITAGHLSTDRMLRLTIIGDYLNNTGTSQPFSVEAEFGGAFLFNDGIANVAASANRRPFSVVVEVANTSATTQVMTARIGLGSATAPANGQGQLDPGLQVTAAGVIAADQQTLSVMGGSGAINTVAAATLGVYVQHGTSNANLSCRKRYALLELL